MRRRQVLALWSIFTFLLFLCTLALNAALATLFILLTITFALLAGGVSHATCDKVAGALVVARMALHNEHSSRVVDHPAPVTRLCAAVPGLWP